MQPKISNFETITLFQSFTKIELEKLISLGHLLSYEAQSNIILEAEQSWGLYLILEGSVGVYKTNKITRDYHEIIELKSGDFFGEFSLIDDHPRSATVKSKTKTQLFFISKKDFLAFLDLSIHVKVNFYFNCVKSLIHRLRELDDQYVFSQYQIWKSVLRGEK